MDKKELETLVNQKYTVAQLSEHFGKGKSTVRHWLKKYGLKTLGKAGAKPKSKIIDGHKECTKCGIRKPLDAFRMRKDRPGTLQPHCKECCTNKTIENNQKHKTALVGYMGGECYDCGLKDDPKVYDFHHIEPEHKDFTIQENRGKSFVKLISELDKCVMLCSNCHVKRHLEMNLEKGYHNKIEGNTERFREIRKQKLDYACDGEPKCSRCGYDECSAALLISYDGGDKEKYRKYNRMRGNWDKDFKRALKDATIVCKNCFRKQV